jgi:hypothetical protein
MARARFSIVSRLPLVPLLIVILSTIGCSGQHSVRGKVTVDDQPLTTGGVRFVPDKGKGNTSTQQPEAIISESGTYEVYTEKKAGAPPGWYKVVVVAKKNLDIAKPKEAESLIDERYSSVDTTDLSIEVKSGGDYDLKLKGPKSTPTRPK